MSILGYRLEKVYLFLVLGMALFLYGGANGLDARLHHNRDADWLDTTFLIIGAIIVQLSFLFDSIDKNSKKKIEDNKKAEWQKQKDQMSRFRSRYNELKKCRR